MGILIARSSTPRQTGGTPVVITTTCLPVQSVQKYVESGMSITVDTIPVAKSLATKWYVVLSTKSGSKSRALEIAGVATPTGIRSCTYGFIGDKMTCSVDVTVVGGAYVLTCVNGETEPVFAYVTRLYVPPTQSMTTTGNINIEHTSSIVRGLSEGTLDTVNKDHALGVKWIVSFTDEDANRYTSQVFALTQAGLNTTYGLLGNSHKSTSLHLIDQFHTISLGITNSLVSDLSVNVVKIPITPELPAVCSTTSDVAVWLPIESLVQPGSTGVVDSQVPIPGHAAVKWMVVLRQSTKTQMFEVMADRYKLLTASHVRYGIVGDSIDVSTNVDIVGMDMVLSLTNNGVEPITINTIRVPIAI